ncbi:hypothetical protein HBH1_02595 [Herbaspirillum sp. BH-1]|nr:hypothetical protein HBH1_02595 [Herbaspirillum sp. BH-1]
MCSTRGNEGNTERPNYSTIKAPDNQKQITDAEINSQHEKNWGVQWPIAEGRHLGNPSAMVTQNIRSDQGRRQHQQCQW